MSKNSKKHYYIRITYVGSILWNSLELSRIMIIMDIFNCYLSKELIALS